MNPYSVTNFRNPSFSSDYREQEGSLAGASREYGLSRAVYRVVEAFDHLPFTRRG